jgi:site-specific DNA-methyltransferase (adenine-specific)
VTSVRYVVGDTGTVVRTIPDASVDLIITSPPFLALRSYLPDDHPDKAKELGSEPNPAAFVDMLLALTAEWRRVLAPHGTLAVELGDTYGGHDNRGSSFDPKTPAAIRSISTGPGWPLSKSLCLIPELYRVALAYGINPLTGQESPAGRWRVRNNVTWCRPNPPVGSLGDKFRPSTSDLVIACTSEKRWFDLDAVRVDNPRSDERHQITERQAQQGRVDGGDNGAVGKPKDQNPAGAPPLDHWVIPPGGYTGSHYAVFPPALLDKPIEACCPRRVCRTCGTPSRRLTTSEYTDRNGGPPKVLMRDRKAEGMNQWDGTGDQLVRAVVTTTGWTSCDCPGTDGLWDPGWRDVLALARAASTRKGKNSTETEAHKAEAARHYATLAAMYHGRLDGYHTGTGWRPGHVLDPFGGSGTTGVVAQGRARDCTLIDLDDRNAELARERLGMFLEVEHHTEAVVA